MVKPTTVSSENQGKDPVEKAKEELKANDESVVVMTSGTPYMASKPRKRSKVCAVVGVVGLVVLVLAVAFFAFAGCHRKREHDEDFESDNIEHGDTDGYVGDTPDGDNDGDMDGNPDGDEGHRRPGHPDRDHRPWRDHDRRE